MNSVWPRPSSVGRSTLPSASGSASSQDSLEPLAEALGSGSADGTPAGAGPPRAPPSAPPGRPPTATQPRLREASNAPSRSSNRSRSACAHEGSLRDQLADNEGQAPAGLIRWPPRRVHQLQPMSGGGALEALEALEEQVRTANAAAPKRSLRGAR